MKRWLNLPFFFLIIFAAGFVGGGAINYRKEAKRAHIEEKHFHDFIKSLRQTIYDRDIRRFPKLEDRLTTFDLPHSNATITLSYVGGFGGNDRHLQLHGNGDLLSINEGKSKLITTLPPERCRTFFHRVLTSGILSYSEGVIALKKDLLRPDSEVSVSCCPNTKLLISIPELNTEKTISVYAPDVEFENYPDIIDLQILTQIEQEILNLVPQNYPLWK